LLDTDAVGPLVDLTAATYWFTMLRPRLELSRWAERVVVDLADRAGGRPRFEEVRAGAAMAAWKRGDLAGARALAEGARPGAEGRFSLEVLAQVDLFEGRLAEAADHAGQAAALFRDAGEDVRAVSAASVGPAALAYGGQPGAAAELADRLARDARRLAVPSMVAMTTYILAEATTDPAVAMAGYERAITLAGEVGADFVVGVATTSLAARELRTGHHHRARRRLGDAVAHWQRAGVRNQGWLAVRLLIEALHCDGEHEAVALLAGAYHASPHAAPAYGEDATRLAEAVAAGERVLGRSRYEQALARGAGLTDDAAATYAHRVAVRSAMSCGVRRR
jgi:hypothetical protein